MTRATIPYRLTALVVATLAAALGPAWAEEPPPPPSPSDAQKIEELEQRLKVLERKEELAKEESAAKEKEAAKVSIGKDGFSVRSADGAYQLKVKGYLHVDSRFFDGTPDDATDFTDNLLLRRARIVLEGTLGKYFDYRLMPDFGEGRTVLQDAYVDVKLAPEFRIRAGKYKPPVGLERLQSANDLYFVERALPTNLVPNRDVGIMLHGEVAEGVFGYAVGVFDGAADGANIDTDTNDYKDFAARLSVQPFKKGRLFGLQGLFFAISGTYGSSLGGTVSATGLSAYRTAGQVPFFAYRAGTTVAATTILDGDRTRFSPQAYWNYGRFGVQAEYVESSADVRRGADTARLSNTAWQATAAVMLTDDASSWKGVSPKQPFDLKARQWGAVELVVRRDRLSVDPDAFPVFANPATAAQAASEWGAGVNWYFNRNFRWMLDACRTTFRGGAPDGDRPRELVYLNRFQISW
ncbi:MAG: OprO/OprP family phosphate-selective porin [Acidobacteria bacterium]|jgi:phosphate-selective porin OprO/OprP|nr:OprO/OprP family phosphate-selective porin [Acidobacteriota bacterium]